MSCFYPVNPVLLSHISAHFLQDLLHALSSIFSVFVVCLIRVYKYIHGANLNASHLAMTTLVSTSVKPSAAHGSEYTARFFLSAKYEESPPQPYPELNLQFDKWRSHCVAVRVFAGFAQEETIAKEIKGLQTSLDGYLYGMPAAAVEEKNSYTIAQYNASYLLSGRVNEVWMNVSGFTAQGCPSVHGGKH